MPKYKINIDGNPVTKEISEGLVPYFLEKYPNAELISETPPAENFQNGDAETDASVTPETSQASNGDSASEDGFSVSRLDEVEIQTDGYGNAITVKEWEEETNAYIADNPDLSADELSAWINRPGGPTESQYTFQEEKEIYEANKEKPKLTDPKYSPSDFVISLYEDPAFDRNEAALSIYDNELKFLKNKQKNYPLMSAEGAEIQKQIDQLEYNKQNELEESRTFDSSQRNKYKKKINDAEAYMNSGIDKYNAGEITQEEFEVYAGRYEDMQDNVFETSYDKEKYQEQNLLLNEITTARTKDTYSSFGESDLGQTKEEKKVFDQRVEDEIINGISGNKKLVGKILDGNVPLAEKEMIITGAKSIVLNKSYDEYVSEYNKAEDIIFAADEAANITPEVANAAQGILYNAAIKIQDTSAELAYNIGEQSFANNFQMTDDFEKWRDRHIDGGYIGDLGDAVGTLIQGGQKLIGDATIGTSIWLNRVAWDAIDSDYFEDNYTSLDMISDTFSNYNNINYFGISDKGGRISMDNLTFRSTTKTIANMLPFTIGVALAARKGDVKGLRTAYSIMRGMGASAQTINKVKMGGFAFRATVNDNYLEGKQMGLSNSQSLAYSTMTSFSTALVQGIMPDSKFFSTTAGATIKKTFVENLKKVTTKDGIKVVTKQFIDNLIGEIGEEEAELLLNDIAKITVGLSNETKFFDFDTQFETIAGTILLAGSTSAVMAPAQFKNYKNKIYNQYRTQGADVITTLQETKKIVENKLKRARTQQSKEAAQRQLNEINSAIEYGADIIKAINVAPDVMNDEQIDLLVQKNQLLDKKSKADPRYTKGIDAEIEAINVKIENSQVTQQSAVIQQKTEAGSKKIAEALGIKFDKGNTSKVREAVEQQNADINKRNEGKKEADKEKLINVEEAVKQNGFIMQNPDGTQSIVINEDVAGTNKAVTTAQHELLHGVLLKTITDNPGAIVQMSNALKSEIDKMIPTGISFNNAYIQGRLEAYKSDPSSVEAEELLTIFSEGLTQGFIAFEENTFTKIGDFIRQGLQRAGMKVTFNSGKDVFNFIKDFNKSVIDNKGLGKGLTKAATEGVKIGKKLGASSAFLYDANFEANVQSAYNSPKLDLPRKALGIAMAYRARVQELINKSSSNVFGSREKTNAIEYALIGRDNPNSIYNTVLNYDSNSKMSLDETIGRTISGIGESAASKPGFKASRKLTEAEENRMEAIDGEIDAISEQLAQNEIQQDTHDRLIEKLEEEYENIENPPKVEAKAKPKPKPKAKTDNVKAKALKKEKVLIGDAINKMIPEDMTSAEWPEVAGKIIVAFQDGMLFPLFKKQIAKMGIVENDIYGKTSKEFYDATIGVQYIKNILNFKPKTKENPQGNDDFGGYIIGSEFGLNNRIKEALTELRKGKELNEASDVSNAKGIVAEESSNEVKEKPKYRSLTDAGVVSGEVIKAVKAKLKTVLRTVKSRMDAAISNNRTVTPLMAEIQFEMGKQADIDLKKAMGGKKDGKLRKFLLKTKKATLQNMTTTWLMGKDGQGGIPQAIQKKVDGKWLSYPAWVGKEIDREKTSTDNAGRTSGALLVRRHPSIVNYKNVDEIIDNDTYLAQFLDETGNPIRGRKEALAKAMAEEISFEIFSTDLADPASEISEAFESNQERQGAILAENFIQQIDNDIDRGNIKFSKSFKNPQFIKIHNIALDILVDKGMDAYNDYVDSVENVELRNLVRNYFDNNLWRAGKFADYKAKNKGLSYEKFIKKVLSATNQKNVKVKLIGNKKGIGGDLILQIGTEIIQIELKLNDNAQMSSFSVKYTEGVASLTKPEVLKTEGGKELLKKLNSENYKKKIEAYHKAALDYAKKEGYFAEIKNGKLRAEGAVFTKMVETGDLAKLNLQIPSDATVIQEMYNNEGVYYVDFGNKGLFYMGEDINGLGVPELKADVTLYARMTKGSKNKQGIYTASMRVFPNINGEIKESTTSLSDVKEIKKFIQSAVNTEKINKGNVGNKAITEGLKSSKPTKGISVFDFDDTLARTKSNVLYAMPDGTKGKLNAAQFAAQSETLLDQGAEFDFSEFSKVMKGELGPLFSEAQKKEGKYTNKDIFVLTARPANSAKAIHEFLRSEGLNIPIENITGLGNGSPQAKADWMVSKIADGYNDFYFADDHMGNVKAVGKALKGKGVKGQTELSIVDFKNQPKAVRDILNTFDVKGPTQRSRIKFNRSSNKTFNDMLERASGIKSRKRLTQVEGRQLGKNKGRFKIWMPSSLEDFRGLTEYTFAGKGRQGDADQKFFRDALITPYWRGINEMDQVKQSLKNGFAALNKKFKPVMKKLGKKIPGMVHTHDQALRVYLWNKAGYEIPGLTRKQERELVRYVQNDAELLAYAKGALQMSQRKEWSKPSDYWDVQTILSDINNFTEKAGRKEYLKEFIDNADLIFSEANLNKIEAIYGKDHRDAIVDILYRMKNGTNRAAGMKKNEQAWNNWLNNSIGAIMFFNRRSALLQTLSIVNFVNWSDNNPMKAAAAFANQAQFWSDFAMIFNSDKLKQRRSGLKTDVNAAELASAVTGATDKASAALNYLLKIGFTPTQMVDSFAIASGGATFYRNRLNTYLKEKGADGKPKYTQKEAEKQAFFDFSVVSRETQQSGDPALISSDQSSSLGRVVLNFMNTPIQLNRSIKKSAQDIYNRRRTPGMSQAQSDFSNFSKIIYYGAIQNAIFSSLQAAMFALIPGFNDDEEEEGKLTMQEKTDKKLFQVINSMVDTTLKGGFGLPGAVVSILKNAIIEYKKQEDRGFLADDSKTLIALLNISPAVGSKARKIVNFIKTERFDKEVIGERGWDVTIDGKFNLSPRWSSAGNLIEGTLNIPTARVVDELNSITEALDSRNTAWQRIALALGWKTWNVGSKNEENDLIEVRIKSENKERKKEENKEKRKQKKLLEEMEEKDRRSKLSQDDRDLEDWEKRQRRKIKSRNTRAKTKKKKDSIKTVEANERIAAIAKKRKEKEEANKNK